MIAGSTVRNGRQRVGTARGGRAMARCMFDVVVLVDDVVRSAQSGCSGGRVPVADMFWMNSRVEHGRTTSGYAHVPDVPVPQQFSFGHPVPLKIPTVFPIPATTQHSFWLNAVAPLNISCMVVTENVFHASIAWLNAPAE